MNLKCKLFKLLVCLGLVMLLRLVLVQHSGNSVVYRDKQTVVHKNNFIADKMSDNLTSDNHLDIQNEINKMHKFVHSLKLTKKKVNELSGNKTLDKFLRRGARLKQKLLDVILNEEDKEPEPKTKIIKKLKTRTIIYNRINKSGSTSLLVLLGGLSYSNSFLLVGQGMPQLRYFQPAQKQSMVNLLCGNRRRDKVIYTRHIYFTDYSKLGCEMKYFNMMRDPVDRFVSRYNFNRELLEIAKSDNIIKQRKEMSRNINECVLKNHTECKYQGVLNRNQKMFRLDSQIPFFCGDFVFCRILGHAKSVEKAKENIEKSFLVVGTLEEMDKTMTVMECIMPEYMKGLDGMNQQTDIHKHSKHDKVIRIPLSMQAREVMKARLSKEYELYEFVKNKLEEQFKECKRRSDIRTRGSI